jgi:hypothetical protein
MKTVSTVAIHTSKQLIEIAHYKNKKWLFKYLLLPLHCLEPHGGASHIALPGANGVEPHGGDVGVSHGPMDFSTSDTEDSSATGE